MTNIRPKPGTVNRRRADFAKGVALAEFGTRHYHDNWDGFIDRTPDELRLLRRAIA